MPQGRNDDGTLDVRVTLLIRVDPEAWVRHMMEEAAPGDTELRRDVKRWVRDYIGSAAVVQEGEVPLEVIRAEGIYDRPSGYIAGLPVPPQEG